MPGVAGFGVRGAGFIVQRTPRTPWGSAGCGFLPFFRPGHDDLSDLSATQFLAHHFDDNSGFCDDLVWAWLQSWRHEAMAIHAPDALFAIVVWLVAERKLDFLNVAPLLFLGEISYSLYLVHQIAGYWVIRQLEGAGLGSGLTPSGQQFCARSRSRLGCESGLRFLPRRRFAGGIRRRVRSSTSLALLRRNGFCPTLGVIQATGSIQPTGASQSGWRLCAGQSKDLASCSVWGWCDVVQFRRNQLVGDQVRHYGCAPVCEVNPVNEVLGAGQDSGRPLPASDGVPGPPAGLPRSCGVRRLTSRHRQGWARSAATRSACSVPSGSTV